MRKTSNKLALLVVVALLIACNAGHPSDYRIIDPNKMALYKEKFRPQFHFSPPQQWMNDPNGMVFQDGVYHLFYQHYPDSNVWGPMHWGHATSEDMIHWAHQPIALYPDSLGYIFSGSAVFDEFNSSGLGSSENPPLVAIFTYHDAEGEKMGNLDFQTQGIAYSLDKGLSWKKYKGNPVLANTEKIKDFRDPKVFFHQQSGQWIMVLAAYDHVRFYVSPDLIRWAHLSNWGYEFGGHGGVWECPDLFSLQDGNQERWVLLVSINPGGPNGGSATQYFIGDFDGRQFSLGPDFEMLVQNGNGVWIDYGRDNYAGVTWSNIPADDGRRLFLGWMSNWDYANAVPTTEWRSAMTLPREIRLSCAVGQPCKLLFSPVAEMISLREGEMILNETSIENDRIVTQVNSAQGFNLQQIELDMYFSIPKGGQPDFGIFLQNDKGQEYCLGFNAATRRFYSDRTRSGKHSFSEKFAPDKHFSEPQQELETINFHLFLDHASAELFVNNGTVTLTDILFPDEPFTKLGIYSTNGRVDMKKGIAYKLRGIWHNK